MHFYVSECGPQELKAAIQQCQEGVQELKRHEQNLFQLGLLQFEKPCDWALLEMEEVLLKMGLLCTGLLYFLVVPPPAGTEGPVAVR